ncbi:hypothetical protein AAFF_G00310910 [Aldrovandia affinis]|uniref:Uncharacterized protein n=1 Tax=Aldrovandia affinis TaxID=143900 RepID=A0AAD7R7V5_9TELE|nr:hypothetical protein AAFF_G00310910 [Aldrovandia affinis]
MVVSSAVVPVLQSLLTSSLPHPEADWQYCAYELPAEVLPGLDLFSGPAQVPVGTAVSSLAFLCHWLYSCGHYLRALPLLSLYLHWAGPVCRDPIRTAEARILKVQVLTELALFGDALRELACLIQGERIPQNHRPFRTTDPQAVTQASTAAFICEEELDTSKPLLESSNLQAVQELVSSRPGSDLCALYGPRALSRLAVARVQLILALCRSIHPLPQPLGPGDLEGPVQDIPRDHSSPPSDIERCPSSEPRPRPVSSPTAGVEEPPRLLLDPERGPRPPAKLKALSGTCLRSVGGDVEELELAIETMLLLSAVSLQQGRPAYSVHAVSPQAGVLEADPSDVPQAVEAGERVGRALWLRCRLALISALVAHIPGTAIHPGVDSSAEAARLLAEGLQEAESWGDPDTRALLLLQGALLHTHRGAPRETSTSLLQVRGGGGALSAQRALSPRSSLSLVSSVLQLSDLSSSDSQRLLLHAHQLLLQQLSALGESLPVGEDGRVSLTSSLGLKNIYLPQLPCWPGPHCTWDWWSSSLVSLDQWEPQAALETFLQAIRVTQPHSHTLQLIRSSYLEMASVYLLQWQRSSSRAQQQQSPTPSCPRDREHKAPGWQKARMLLDRAVTERELLLLYCWVCVRAASQVSEAISGRARLCAAREPLQPPDARCLPELTASDLLSPCGGLEPLREFSSVSPALGAAGPHCPEMTWAHLARYHAHILNLHHIATRPVPGCGALLSPRLPAVLLQPHSAQSAGREGTSDDTFPWASAANEQLCLQWHRPQLDPSQNQDTVLLTFTLNRSPLSAQRPTTLALSQLQCGQRPVSLNRLRAVHADLRSVCMRADVSSPPFLGPKRSGHAEKEMLQERSRSVCAQIRALLQLNPDPALITEVPFEPSLQNLSDLERCFNPGGGALLSEGGIIQWLASLLL